MALPYQSLHGRIRSYACLSVRQLLLPLFSGVRGSSGIRTINFYTVLRPTSHGTKLLKHTQTPNTMASVETLTPAPVEPYYSRGLRERYRADALQNLSSTEQSTKYADITYEVDHAKYLARCASRLTSEQLAQELPAGFPKKLDGPLVWSTKDLESKEHEYVYMITSEDKAEVFQALEHFNSNHPSHKVRFLCCD